MRGAEQVRIARLQTSLRSLGLYHGRADGIAGPLTLRATDRLFRALPHPPTAGRDTRPDVRLAAACALTAMVEALQAHDARR